MVPLFLVNLVKGLLYGEGTFLYYCYWIFFVSNVWQNRERGTVDFAEESDEEDDAVPRKRRRAERAAEGEVEDEEVMFEITDFRRRVFPCNKLGIFS